MGTIFKAAAFSGSRTSGVRRGRHGVRALAVLSAVLDWLLEAMERARQRRALQMLDDRLLKDIGLTRADAERETSRPFWRI